MCHIYCVQQLFSVCRDMEFRINNSSNSHGRIAEVCIDDEWYEATSAKIANKSQSPQDISVMIADSTSVMIKWSMTYHAQHHHSRMGRSMK